MRVVIIDNDVTGSSREVCESRESRFRWKLQYAVEARRGIPFARNAAVAAIRWDADAVVFVDDDETVESDWLERLLHTRQTYSAAVVAGPVIPSFESPPPKWAQDGLFFRLPRYITGSLLDRAFTNNVMVDAVVFRHMERWFDERLRYSGGSDTHFFRRLHLAGHRIVWCDEAIVHDLIPSDRVSIRWVVQRAYRYGHTHAFVRRDLGQDTRASLSIAALRRIGQPVTSAVVGVVQMKGWRLIESLTEMAYIAGMLVNVAGIDYEEYSPSRKGS